MFQNFFNSKKPNCGFDLMGWVFHKPGVEVHWGRSRLICLLWSLPSSLSCFYIPRSSMIKLHWSGDMREPIESTIFCGESHEPWTHADLFNTICLLVLWQLTAALFHEPLLCLHAITIPNVAVLIILRFPLKHRFPPWVAMWSCGLIAFQTLYYIGDSKLMFTTLVHIKYH